MQIRRTMCLLILVLSGCAEYPITNSDWPTGLPAYEIFRDNYRRDSDNAQYQSLEQYLTWAKRFYLGWELYPTGWNSLSRDLMLRIDDPSMTAKLEASLKRLGTIIAAEWAKDNRIRRINTRQVSIWGNALLNSIQHHETSNILELVAKDVEDLLENRISSDEITENRFYAEEDIFKDIN